MRALRAFFLGVVMSLVLVAGVASAAPGQSSWESNAGTIFDQCTGENVNNTTYSHFVETESGPSHFNVHIVGIGETSGALYVGNNLDNEFFHALPDGTFMIDQVLNIRLVSQGNLSNALVLAVHIHLVLDADFNVISGKIDITGLECQGS
jgi:hypothetical protein